MVSFCLLRQSERERFMKKFWQYLVEHEKAVAAVTLILVFALFWQWKNKTARLAQTTELSQTHNSDSSANRAEPTSGAKRRLNVGNDCAKEKSYADLDAEIKTEWTALDGNHKL